MLDTIVKAVTDIINTIHIGKIAPLGYGIGVFVLVAGSILIVTGIVLLIVYQHREWSTMPAQLNAIVVRNASEGIYDANHDQRRRAAAERLNIIG